MKRVGLPDGSVGEFPDTMPDAAIEGVLRRQFPPPTALARLKSGVRDQSLLAAGLGHVSPAAGRIMQGAMNLATDVLIPETPAEALAQGISLLTVPAGGAAALRLARNAPRAVRAAAPVVGRIVGNVVPPTAMSALTGHDPGRTAAVTGTATAGMEGALSAATNILQRVSPWARKLDIRRLGQQAGEALPEFLTTDAQDLYRLVKEGVGQKIRSGMLGKTFASLEDILFQPHPVAAPRQPLALPPAMRPSGRPPQPSDIRRPEPHIAFEGGPMVEGEGLRVEPLPPPSPRMQPSDVRDLLTRVESTRAPLSQRESVARTLEAAGAQASGSAYRGVPLGPPGRRIFARQPGMTLPEPEAVPTPPKILSHAGRTEGVADTINPRLEAPSTDIIERAVTSVREVPSAPAPESIGASLPPRSARQPLVVPALGPAPVMLRDATRRLEEVTEQAFPESMKLLSYEDRLKVRDAKRLYVTLRRQIPIALDRAAPGAGKLFDLAYQRASAQAAYLSLLNKAITPEGVPNFRALQSLVNKNPARWAARLGPYWPKMQSAIFRGPTAGPGPGAVDRPAAHRAWQEFTNLLFRQYRGPEAPFVAGSTVRTIADVAAQNPSVQLGLAGLGSLALQKFPGLGRRGYAYGRRYNE